MLVKLVVVAVVYTKKLLLLCLPYVLHDSFKQIRTVLGRNPDKSRNPYENKVPIVNRLYLYRAAPCTSIRNFQPIPYLFSGFDVLSGSLPKMVLMFSKLSYA